MSLLCMLVYIHLLCHKLVIPHINKRLSTKIPGFLRSCCFKFHEMKNNKLHCCCCQPPASSERGPSPRYPRSRPHTSWSDQRASSPAAPSGLSHSASGPKSFGNPGQLNRCLVLCGCVWHRGQFGVGRVSGVILCRYSCKIGDLFVRSCAMSLLV